MAGKEGIMAGKEGIGQARGANMMMAIPNNATPEPNKSQAVGRIPSTAHNQKIAIKYKRPRRRHTPDPQQWGARKATRQTTPGLAPLAPTTRPTCLHATTGTASNSPRSRRAL